MILLITLLATPVQDASDWYALLQTQHTWECSADFLISGGDNPVLVKGLPLGSVGSVPAGLPWPDGSTTDPLHSGIWGGGRWNTSFTDGEIQDSISISRIGLIQNTGDHSRYSFELDRPLPWNTSGNFEMIRNDSLTLNSALFTRGRADFRLTGWEGDSYGWGCWTGWTSDSYYARAGFSRLYADDRRPELLAGVSAELGAATAELGGAVAYVDSSMEYRGAGGLSIPLGDISATASADFNGEEAGYWGGVNYSTGEVLYSAMYSNPSSGQSFQAVSIRHSVFTLIGRISEEPAVAADIQISQGLISGKAAGGWFFDSDSLEISCHLLLGYNWYRGRLEAGPRVTAAMNSQGEWVEKVDGVAGFTLLPFSIAAGLENISNPLERSWSFGITWAFTDRPPQAPEGEESGRERD